MEMYMSNAHFNAEQDMATMKQDIADRAFNIKLKGMVITGVFFAAALALALTGVAGAASPLLALAVGAGGAVAGLVTMKEAKKLEIDEEFLQTRMQGGNWWKGYRREVMQHGGDTSSAPFVGNPNPRDLGR
jgi:hypothetical protein